jgi:hypothetical protein
MTERGGDRSDLHVVKSAPEARQAATGHNARYVLIVGLVAVIVLFAMVYGYYFR